MPHPNRATAPPQLMEIHMLVAMLPRSRRKPGPEECARREGRQQDAPAEPPRQILCGKEMPHRKPC